MFFLKRWQKNQGEISAYNLPSLLGLSNLYTYELKICSLIIYLIKGDHLKKIYFLNEQYVKKNMRAYLSGPIENAENDGASWRQEITFWLNKNLNHKVFNPVLETKNIIGHLNASNFRSMKKTDPLQYKKIIRKIIKLDLEAVINDSDYLIVKWDKSVLNGGGTHGEVTMAYWIKKPIFIVNSLPIDDMSSWIFSCSDFIFDNFTDLKTKLMQLYS